MEICQQSFHYDLKLVQVLSRTKNSYRFNGKTPSFSEENYDMIL
ncbi:chaperone HscA [Enterococcus casseliflavus]|nr:chaperone HscA [Enterococcus gallinarum]EPH97640.1 hypothetical protein D922_00154 [Enterococcus faecalis 06-MB-DW-09]MBO1098457.1 chaperone HscA [Enterococcus casseliflavus]MBO1143469.1 chaperone HscA [Enterococcus casseliflavus]